MQNILIWQINYLKLVTKWILSCKSFLVNLAITLTFLLFFLFEAATAASCSSRKVRAATAVILRATSSCSGSRAGDPPLLLWLPAARDGGRLIWRRPYLIRPRGRRTGCAKEQEMESSSGRRTWWAGRGCAGSWRRCGVATKSGQDSARRGGRGQVRRDDEIRARRPWGTEARLWLLPLRGESIPVAALST